MKKNMEYQLKDGFENMNFYMVPDMLKDVFWSIGIKEDEVVKASANSALLVGVFDSERQIAFARVISDKTRFAYIADVVVHKDYRNKGIARSMIEYILNHHELKDVYQWLLKTRDAHGLYEKSGFKLISDPGSWMGIMKERPER